MALTHTLEIFLHFETKLRAALLLTSKDMNNHKINERADGQESRGELPLDVARVSDHPLSGVWCRVKPPHLNCVTCRIQFSHPVKARNHAEFIKPSEHFVKLPLRKAVNPQQ